MPPISCARRWPGSRVRPSSRWRCRRPRRPIPHPRPARPAARRTAATLADAAPTPAAGAITNCGSLDHISAYTIITEKDGNRFEWSALANPTSLPGLNFASATERDDDLLRVQAINGMVWLFGTASTEIWYETGLGGADAFQQIAGGSRDTGLKAFGLVTKFDGGAFFVGDDNLVRITSGADFQVVSTPAVVSAIMDSNPVLCIHYEHRGHKFCAIVFEDRPAFVFDLATFELRSQFVYPGEGWGLTQNGKQLIMSDGTATLRFLDPFDPGDHPDRKTLAAETRLRIVAALAEIRAAESLADLKAVATRVGKNPPAEVLEAYNARKAALADAGWWSPAALTDDVEVTWRMQLAGWRVAFEPKALCWIWLAIGYVKASNTRIYTFASCYRWLSLDKVDR